MLSYHSDKLFVFKVTVTLTFDLMTSKSIWVIYCSPPVSMSKLRAMSAGNVKLSLWQDFNIQGHCDLDLWPDDLKISRGHLLVTPSLYVKFEGHGYRQYYSDQLFVFKVTVTLTFDLMTSESTGSSYSSGPTFKSSLRTIDLTLLSYHSDKLDQAGPWPFNQ